MCRSVMFTFTLGCFWGSRYTVEGKTYLGLIQQPGLEMTKEALAGLQRDSVTTGFIFLRLCEKLHGDLASVNQRAKGCFNLWLLPKS